MKLNLLLARNLYEVAHLHATCQIMNACIHADQERKLLFAVSDLDGLAAPITVVPFATSRLHKPRAVIPKRKFDFLNLFFYRTTAMTSLSQPPKATLMLAGIVGAPILFAFLIASLPVLVPVLFYRWIAQLPKPVLLISPALATAAAA